MPVSPAIADIAPEAQRWRRHLHAHPELLYDVNETAAFVAARLAEFGCDEVRTGLGRTGVVGVIKGRKGGERTGHRPARRHGCAADRRDD